MFTHRGTDARLIAECLEPVSQGIKIVLNIKNLQYFVVRVLMQNWMTDGLAVTQKRTWGEYTAIFLHHFYQSFCFFSEAGCLSQNWPQGYKTSFMLNSVENKIFPAHKC